MSVIVSVVLQLGASYGRGESAECSEHLGEVVGWLIVVAFAASIGRGVQDNEAKLVSGKSKIIGRNNPQTATGREHQVVLECRGLKLSAHDQPGHPLIG